MPGDLVISRLKFPKYPSSRHTATPADVRSTIIHFTPAMDDEQDMTSSDDNLDITKATKRALGLDEYIDSKTSHINQEHMYQAES